jgi:hypothetical protein
VTLRRARSGPRQVWELDIDKLTGPFRNHKHFTLTGPFGDRANFQASFGLDMTERELEKGDRILEAMYDPAISTCLEAAEPETRSAI